MIITLDENTMINTNFIQYVDKKDDQTVVLTMADSKRYEKKETMEQVKKWLLHYEQHPPVTHNIKIVDK